MTLRKDELFVVEKLASFLGGEWREGENPPDAYITIGGKTALLEITQLTESVINEDGTPEVRRTQDSYGMRLALEMEKTLKGVIPVNQCLFLHIAVPIKNPKKFRASLERSLRNFLSKTSPQDGTTEIAIDEEVVEVQLLRREEPTDLAVGAMVSNKNSNADILKNAVFALRDRITEKEKICFPLPFGGPRWLGLFNDYWLADERTYQQALEKAGAAHGFERIYLVSQNGAIYRLFG